MSKLETILAPKIVSLDNAERKKYGSINEQNKLVVNKVKELSESSPELKNPDLDWDEFKKDFDSRDFSEKIVFRLRKIARGIDNKKILHDNDNYNDALNDYSYAQFKAGSSDPKANDYLAKAQELAQFFSRTGTAKKDAADSTDPTA